MSDTKIKIDLSSGVIEAEGSEQFVKSIYADFKEQIKTHPPEGKQGTGAKRTRSASTKSNKQSAKKPKSKGRPSQKLVRNLNLSKQGSILSLREFYKKYKPKSNMERNLLFCYYLQEIKKFGPITIDAVYTCYNNIPRLRTPKNLYQSLVDTSRIKGWINSSSMDAITMDVQGKDYIDIDMDKSENEEL